MKKCIRDRRMSVGIGSLAIGFNNFRMKLTSDSSPKALGGSLFTCNQRKC